MTAIVGIMNKHAAVLAADSATTYPLDSNHNVITNYANKIISLSKYHPIGVMLYNSATLEDIPWELILKLYRDQHLKDGHFQHVKDYFDDLKRYLAGKNYFVDSDVLKNNIIREVKYWIDDLKKVCKSKSIEWEIDNIEGINNEIETIIAELSKIDVSLGCENYSLDNFKLYIEEDLRKNYEDDNVVTAIFDNIEKYLYNNLIRNILNYTGLVFVGYGDDDIFPQLYTVLIGSVLDGNLRYLIVDDYGINHNQSAVIAPYAQTDVINTIIRGIDPNCMDAVNQSFEVVFNEFLIKLKEQCTNGQLEQVLNNINIEDYKKGFEEAISKYIGENYLLSLYHTISYLDKEGLIEIAESLISLTSLQRKMTSSEASVGGPVDVAVITKTEGLVWIHRKYYFDPELNYQFLNRQKL